MVTQNKHLRLIEQLFSRLDWPRPVREHHTFPLDSFSIDFDSRHARVWISYRHRDTGKRNAIEDFTDEFPSDDLVAAFNLLAGDLSEAREEHRERVREMEYWIKRRENRRRSGQQ